MKILITGANGFVGSHLCEKLLTEGHSVYALVRSPKKMSIPAHPQLAIIQGDLDQEKLLWVESLPADLETVIHTAGIVHSYIENEFYKVNSVGTKNLINNLKNKFSQIHFILVSSLAASGPSLEGAIRNEDILDLPISAYGKSKKQAEDSLMKLSPSKWILSVVKPPMVIGPRDPAILDIFKMVQSGIIILPGKNSKTKSYSFVCVFDLIDTITKIVTLKKQGVFFSANPNIINFNQLILEIKKQLDKKAILFLPLPLFFVRTTATILSFIHRIFPHKLRLTPDKYHELAAENWTCSALKSEQELTQIYTYDIEKTITITLADYKNRKWI